MYKVEPVIGCNTKPSELILKYPDLLEALDHLNIKLGFGEETSKELTDRHNINFEAFSVIVHTYCDQLSPEKIIKKEALGDLLVFLRNSHNDFKKNQIPELKKLIALFADEIPDKHGKVLISFFDEYINEVFDHFKYEDETVFPYIETILENRRTNGFAMLEFEKNHTDIEQKLLDLKNILIKYIPEESYSELRRQILRYLFDFEKQLFFHTKLENHVLTPSVKKFEKKERRGNTSKQTT